MTFSFDFFNLFKYEASISIYFYYKKIISGKLTIFNSSCKICNFLSIKHHFLVFLPLTQHISIELIYVFRYFAFPKLHFTSFFIFSSQHCFHNIIESCISRCIHYIYVLVVLRHRKEISVDFCEINFYRSISIVIDYSKSGNHSSPISWSKVSP